MDMPTKYFLRENEILAWPIAVRCEAVPGFQKMALAGAGFASRLRWVLRSDQRFLLLLFARLCELLLYQFEVQ